MHAHRTDDDGGVPVNWTRVPLGQFVYIHCASEEYISTNDEDGADDGFPVLMLSSLQEADRNAWDEP